MAVKTDGMTPIITCCLLVSLPSNLLLLFVMLEMLQQQRGDLIADKSPQVHAALDMSGPAGHDGCFVEGDVHQRTCNNVVDS